MAKELKRSFYEQQQRSLQTEMGIVEQKREHEVCTCMDVFM